MTIFSFSAESDDPASAVLVSAVRRTALRLKIIAQAIEEFGHLLPVAVRRDTSDESERMQEKDEEQIPEQVVRFLLEKADPTPEKMATHWLVRQYTEGGVCLRDVDTAHEALEMFFKYVDCLPPDKRDLTQYSNLGKAWEAVVGFAHSDELLKIIHSSVQNFGHMLREAVRQDVSQEARFFEKLPYEELPEQVVRLLFNQADPTPRKLATSWLVKQYAEGNLCLRDISTARETLEMFQRRVKDCLIPADRRDLGQYPNLAAVRGTVIRFADGGQPRRQRPQELAQPGVSASLDFHSTKSPASRL
jgi:hypothetical protein